MKQRQPASKQAFAQWAKALQVAEQIVLAGQIINVALASVDRIHQRDVPARLPIAQDEASGKRPARVHVKSAIDGGAIARVPRAALAFEVGPWREQRSRQLPRQ